MTNGTLANTNLLNMEITAAIHRLLKAFILKSSASRSAASATTASTPAFCLWVVTRNSQI
jgi:hypothetical protein